MLPYVSYLSTPTGDRLSSRSSVELSRPVNGLDNKYRTRQRGVVLLLSRLSCNIKKKCYEPVKAKLNLCLKGIS